MKRELLFTLTIFAASLTGCSLNLHPDVDERLSFLPMQPHTQEIDIFFLGESPQEEYIKLAAVETKAGEKTPYISLVNDLKSKARAYGADALMVHNKHVQPDVYTDLLTEWVTTRGINSLEGIAIKYRKNLDTSLMPKQQKIERYDAATDTFSPLLDVELSHVGEVKALAERQEQATILYNTFVRKYSLQHLKTPDPQWLRKMENGLVVERQLRKGGLLEKRIRFNYDADKRVSHVRVQIPDVSDEEIHYVYDAAGKVSKRLIYTGKSPYLEEAYSYDAAGNVSEVLVYDISTAAKQPFLRKTYSYYTLDEL